jgi:hypothetical protein
MSKIKARERRTDLEYHTLVGHQIKNNQFLEGDLARPHPAFSPWEKVWPSQVFGLADRCPANPVAPISKEAPDDFTLSHGERAG